MRNLSLNAKVSLVLAVAIFGTVVVAGVGIYNSAQGQKALDDMVNTFANRKAEALQIDDDAYRIRNADKATALAATAELTKPEIAAAETTAQELESLATDYRKISSEQGQRDADNILAALAKWKPEHEALVKAAQAGDKGAATDLAMFGARAPMGAISKIAADLVSRNTKYSADAAQRFNGAILTARYILIGASLATIALSIAMAFTILRALSNSVGAVISTLSNASEQTKSAAAQVSQSSASLSQGASEQAASVEETSSTLEEISSTTKQAVERAAQGE